MKKLFIIVMLLLFCKEAFTQNYYYYQGRKIDLEQRTDKAAIILNSNSLSKESKEDIVSEILPQQFDSKEIAYNVYLVDFVTQKSASEVQSFISGLPGRNNLIKFVTPVFFGESKKVMQIVTDEFIVRLRNIKDREYLDILNARNNVTVIGSVSDDKGFLLKSGDNEDKNALELSSIYFSTGIFVFAEPNFLYPEFSLLNFTPNDPLYNFQWSLNNTGQEVPTGSNLHGDQNPAVGLPNADMDVNLAWDFTTGSSLIRIGIFDTGIDSTHPDFSSVPGHLETGYDAFYNSYGVPKDSGFYGGHGTCVAGLAGALMNNATGIAGVAPQCKLMAFRIFNVQGSSSNFIIGRAFDTARIKGIDILCNSWSGGTPNSVVTDAINNAADSGRGGLGCVILFASGNEGHSSVWYPSYLNKALSIGGSTPHDQKKSPGTGNQFWWGGNYGEDLNGDLDFVAPTVCYTTDIQGGFGYSNENYFKYFNGTSTSCPNAAGIAALILSVNPSQSRLDVFEKLCRGCDKIDKVSYGTQKAYGLWNNYFGYGRVNAFNSVRLAAGVDVTPPTINHQIVYSHSSTFPTNIFAEIIDHDGAQVPSSGDLQPKLFFRINNNQEGWAEFDSLTADTNTGNNFMFVIPCAGYETQVEYYIRAYDIVGNSATFPRGAPNLSKLCYFAIGSITSESQRIDGFTGTDPGVSYSPSVIFSNFAIVDSKVELFLRHSRLSDEIIELFGPVPDGNNNRKCLFSSNGRDGINITGAMVCDSATQFWSAGIPPYYNGRYKGDYLLNGLNGTNASGEWKILNYDPYTGNQAVFDSIRVTFNKTSGNASASIRKNSESDSILNFGIVNYPDSITKNFYLFNAGNSDLNISEVTFSGTYADNFSLLNTLPLSISQNDSAFLIISFDSSDSGMLYGGPDSDGAENAVMNIINNDPSKSIFRVSLQTDSIIPNFRVVSIHLLIQGFYNPLSDSLISDTISVNLRNSSSPYLIVDSASVYLSVSGTGSITLQNIIDSADYYLQIKHRNSIETWSNTCQILNFKSSYDFTISPSSAYGNNLVKVNNDPERFAIFGGDVNQSGDVDAEDITLVFNDMLDFVTGYTNTDLTGDENVDVSDLILTFNNSVDFVSIQRP